MNILKTADLHLTTNKLDEYRWDFVYWLIQYCKEKRIDRVDILGDLTVKKDSHPSELVNRLVDALSELSECCSEGVYILKGNHDYIDEKYPFFAFLDRIEGLTYIKNDVLITKDSELFIPHSQNPEHDWSHFKFGRNLYSAINVHQCFIGAMSNGHRMDKGADHHMFDNFDGTVYSGDIHQRQTVGKVLYIGAPYPINFGDSYEPRLIVLNRGRENSVPLYSIRKWTLKISSEKDLKEIGHIIREGDQVKVVIRLHQSEMHEWKRLRDLVREKVKKAKAILCGVSFEKIKTVEVKSIKGKSEDSKLTNPQILGQFCANEGLSKTSSEAALEILKRAEEKRL